MQSVIELSQLEVKQKLIEIEKKIDLYVAKKITIETEKYEANQKLNQYTQKCDELYQSQSMDFNLIQMVTQQINLIDAHVKKLDFHIELLQKEIVKQELGKDTQIVELNVLENAQKSLTKSIIKLKEKKQNKIVDQIVNDQAISRELVGQI
ncbi:hypothetical protein [Marinicellulosiphila megalodicopiae]|uniref:hypothetical protein n=1 Tax=Marinicellulosiphila megalodicopiae TaxID=2724896 RepID=UPI003BAF1A6A